MKSSPPFSLSRSLILLLIVVALAFGGTTELWEQALFTIFAAALILVAPPKHSLSTVPTVLFCVLLVLALGAFLPAALSTGLPWRSRLTDDLHLSLPATRTPQPWLTAQGCCLLFVGLVWIAYVLSQRWTSETRLQAARLLVFGVAILASVALLAFSLDFRVPTWNQAENRGWFPNRNQTADVLAICGVINYALIFDCLRKKRASLYLWLCTIVLIAAALVVSYSRAGILMFFGGVALWHLWPTQHQRRGSAAKWTALSLALIFVLLTLFLLFGGNTLERFEGPLRSSQDNSFRWAIQQDAFNFSLQSPGLGVGLGNFEPLFASARHASVNADRVVHPESDWLWATCELGWLTPIIFLLGIGWWLRRCLPFHAKSGESLRRAITVAGLLFVLHGFVDVSAHRLGSLCVGLLVFSLAAPAAASEELARARMTLPIFRGCALVMLVIGSWWLASAFGLFVPPTSAKLDSIERQVDDALAHNQLPRMESLTTAGLQIAPLNWHLYFQRAYAETFQSGKLAQASNDFAVARSLESKWVKPCFDEGATWLAGGQPDLCIDAWEEAMRRATPGESLNLYKEMLALGRSNDMVHTDLLEMAGGRIDYQLIFLDFASQDETKQLIDAILAQDPHLQGLNSDQRQKLFGYWWNQGDRPKLIAALTANPDWLESGWFFLAQSYAQQKDFQGAWTIIARCAPPPLVPTVTTTRSIDDLQSAFYDRSDDFPAGLLLSLAQSAQGHSEDAISTLRAMEKNKNCPKYVYYLEAKLWAAKQQWELAWIAWWNFRQA